MQHNNAIVRSVSNSSGQPYGKFLDLLNSQDWIEAALYDDLLGHWIIEIPHNRFESERDLENAICDLTSPD
ncbi:MAG: hypothetical protein AAF702_44425 [Chloroflexota bacterium]